MLRLQSFSHLVSRYERPNQRWVCGWAASGRPCRIGPNNRGGCRARFECDPMRVGDRWECTRAPSAGGKCAGGPAADGTCSCAILRCLPVRSLRARRIRVGFLMFSAVLGLLALLIGGRSAAWLVEPGGLAAPHAGIRDCGTCHTSFAAGPTGWLHAALADATPENTTKPCLGCHEIGALPLAAHSLDATTLTSLGQALVAPGAAAPLQISFTLPSAARGAVGCSNCHREHMGAGAKLTSVGDEVCQTCHAVTFGSFANGHPEFRNYPFRRRTAIIFDHAAHYDRDFARSDKSLVPADCTGCHALDALGQSTIVKPFDVSCGGCHLDQIRGKEATGDKGVALLAVPGLDLDTLRGHGAAIGGWPENSDATMTPLLRYLLSKNDETAKDFATLAPLSLDDLRNADAAQLAAAEQIVWRIKELLFDLGMQGPAMIGRAAGAMNASLVAGLPPDAVRAAEAEWFPDLADEVTRHRAGATVPMTSGKPAAPGDATAPQPAADAGGNASILGGSGGLLGGAPAPQPAPGNTPILGGGGLLGGAPASQPAPDNAPILGGSGLLGGGNVASQDKVQSAILGGDALLGPPAALQPEAARPAPDASTAKPVDGETWAALSGGWYRLGYALYYRPAGHADPFLHDWLDAAGREAKVPDGPAARLFRALSDEAAPGVCAKCHGIDRQADGTLAVSWLPHRPDAETHGFTKFGHRPHLALFPENGCKSCHQIDPKADFAATYKGGDPLSFAAAFQPINRQLCADCHVTGRAPETCVTCHDYHVGKIGVPASHGETAANTP